MTASTRPLYSAADLTRLINPKIVAVVGASETRGSFGERTLANMAAFTGKVFAVNPKYQTLLGRPCVPSLAEMPDSWEKGHFAAAHITPKNTGSYFIIVEVEQSPEERTHWALVYGFR